MRSKREENGKRKKKKKKDKKKRRGKKAEGVGGQSNLRIEFIRPALHPHENPRNRRLPQNDLALFGNRLDPWPRVHEASRQ